MTLPTINYNKEGDNVNNGFDNIAVRKYIAGFEGGRSLDVTGWSDTTIPVLTPIVSNGNGSYKPLAPSASAWVVPEGYSVVGLTALTIKTSRPAVPVMYAGVVNETLLPHKEISWSEIKKALPHIMFMKDEA